MKFRCVDKILSWTPHQHIRGLKAVSFEEYSLKEPFGDQARLPESLLLESFFQLGNWLILLSTDFQQMGLVVRLTEARFPGALRPGQQMCMEVVLTRRHADGFEFTGEGRVNGQTVIAGLGCLATPVPVADYADPADLRVLFEEIFEPAQR